MQSVVPRYFFPGPEFPQCERDNGSAHLACCVEVENPAERGVRWGFKGVASFKIITINRLGMLPNPPDFQISIKLHIHD
jgi:hypothetical protein